MMPNEPVNRYINADPEGNCKVSKKQGHDAALEGATPYHCSDEPVDERYGKKQKPPLVVPCPGYVANRGDD